jgi:hypothetical protein
MVVNIIYIYKMQNDDQITAEIFNSTIEGFIIKLLRENELMSFDEIIENASHVHL